MKFYHQAILILFLVFGVFIPSAAWAEPAVTAAVIRITGNMDTTRIEIEFDAAPQIEPRLLSSPHRLVLDMQETLFAFGPTSPLEDSLVGSFRTGLIQAGRSRMVLALNAPVRFSGVSNTPKANGSAFVFAITLEKSDETDFIAAIQEQVLTTSSTAGGKSDRVVIAGNDKAKKFTLVIDPGHGGIDGGASGEGGTIEKAMTLLFANELATALRTSPDINVFLSRNDDRFIALDERVRIARQLNADLFMSIHADSISDKSLRGATVYTLSDKASDAVSRQVAQQENLSDAIGGVAVVIEDQSVADILIDLTRRETAQQSVGFARATVEALGRKTSLIHNPHRSAGFRVLRAADIPSILVELGYLSNADDEKQINDPIWRRSVVDELSNVIKTYAKDWSVAQR